MRKDLLLRLADLLEADAAKPDGIKFDLAAWAYDANNGGIFNNRLTAGAIPLNCNTAACAMGLAVLSGIFKEEGLDYKINDFGNLTPTLGEHCSYEAAERLFEISLDAAGYLFYESNYPTDKRTGAEAELFVAQRIRQYVDSDGVIPD